MWDFSDLSSIPFWDRALSYPLVSATCFTFVYIYQGGFQPDWGISETTTQCDLTLFTPLTISVVNVVRHTNHSVNPPAWIRTLDIQLGRCLPIVPCHVTAYWQRTMITQSSLKFTSPFRHIRHRKYHDAKNARRTGHRQSSAQPHSPTQRNSYSRDKPWRWGSDYCHYTHLPNWSSTGKHSHPP